MDIGEIRKLIWSQYGAVLEMMENAIEKCPEDLWSDRSRKPQFSQLVFHALFFADLYLSDSVKGFAPPAPFGLSELDRSGKKPEIVYSREDLKKYVEHCRDKCKAKLDGLTDDAAAQLCGFSWVKVSVCELFVYSLRHVQHHVGQLNLILRQVSDQGSTWVFKSTREFETSK
jgi:uncharacterized damage-inducible protein DinB